MAERPDPIDLDALLRDLKPLNPTHRISVSQAFVIAELIALRYRDTHNLPRLAQLAAGDIAERIQHIARAWESNEAPR